MPPLSPWTWDSKLKHYRNTKTGRFISNAEMLRMRDEFVTYRRTLAVELATRFFSTGEGSVDKWVAEMQKLLEVTYRDSYLLGLGGFGRATSADLQAIDNMIATQLTFLRKFAIDIKAGKLGLGNLVRRAAMYIESATQAFERAHAKSTGIPKLPVYPGDGNSECLSYCKCSWRIQEEPTRWLAYWELGIAEHCPTCVANNNEYYPYVVEK